MSHNVNVRVFEVLDDRKWSESHRVSLAVCAGAINKGTEANFTHHCV